MSYFFLLFPTFCFPLPSGRLSQPESSILLFFPLQLSCYTIYSICCFIPTIVASQILYFHLVLHYNCHVTTILFYFFVDICNVYFEFLICFINPGSSCISPSACCLFFMDPLTCLVIKAHKPIFLRGYQRL